MAEDSAAKDSAAPAATTAAPAATDTAADTKKDTTPVTADTVLATVGDTKITVGHLLTARDNLPQQYQKIPTSVIFPGLLNQLVQQEVLKQSYKGTVPKIVQYSLDNTDRSIMASVALADYLQANINDDMLKAEYNKEYGDGYEPKEEWHAAHILVKTEDEAKAVEKDLKDGADFAKEAKEKSTGPSGPNGGDLGWFSDGMMVPDFQKAVAALKPGEVSAPVKTQFGWHVIKLIDTRKQAPKFEDVKAQLQDKVQQDLAGKYIDSLVAGAQVDKSAADGIDPSQLDKIDLSE
ncbi:peptidylprolyl isomerase [Pseudooceanicola sp. CBS1P-1]|uniref:Parvulin-like PPIase n=2 Tax=Paracoccaceae TaxID=31989 RepID=A0A6L7FZ42_9RHOB|nr:peptidylprolyl isomerase [Pseudooceanicola endophyticus]MXN16702.1 peptidylprolyl isomerase [Pseudooceanicola albus]